MRGEDEGVRRGGMTNKQAAARIVEMYAEYRKYYAGYSTDGEAIALAIAALLEECAAKV